MNTQPIIAAVDLGSNSFHMVIAEVTPHGLRPLERLKGRVRLAAGLGADGLLSEQVQRRALSCLRRFGARLAGLPPGSVRAVGTSTLRKAGNALPFLIRARAALGHPIEVITGTDEARLIYRGVAEARGAAHRRLVVDIGGGSTECVVGEGPRVHQAVSLDMGCVAFTERFFPGGRVDAAAMGEAVDEARRVAAAGVADWPQRRWSEVVGTSGTLRAVRRVLDQQGWSEGDVTPSGLALLRRRLIVGGRPERYELPGMDRDRAAVFAGGVAVLSGVVEALDLTRLDTSRAALREGVVSELLDRQGLSCPRRWSERRKAVAVRLAS